MAISALAYLLLIIAGAFVGGVLLKSVKQPPVVGYLLAGFFLRIVIGDHAAGEIIEFLAELGIVLLLFTLGLEFSLSKLKRVANIAVVGGIIQILSTIIIGIFILPKFGFDLYTSLFMSAAFSLSSTAIVVKLLIDRGEIDSLPGEIMVGWLVVQDLAVLPMIILLPTIGHELFSGGVGAGTVLVLFKDILFIVTILVLIVIVGKRVIPWLLTKIASLNDRELLLVAVFGLAVASASVSHSLGLSAALGAFIAGLLIAESNQANAIFSEIRPLRDIFSLLFFASLGILLPSGFIFSHFFQILGITAVVMSIKFVIVMALTIYLGLHARTSFIVGVGLIEVGEFAFILAKLGLSENVIGNDAYGIILSVALLSILLMPPIYIISPQLYVAFRSLSKKRFPKLYVSFFRRFDHKLGLDQLQISNHVVLCGYGRVGRYIGRALSMADIPFVVIEYNNRKAEVLKRNGIMVVYGDPSDVDILDYAQVDTAKAVIIAVPDLHTQTMIITNSLTLNKNIQLYCRTHHESDQKHLKALGVHTIIQPEFEASISITSKILKSFGKNQEDIEGKVTRLKIEHGMS